jgi:hypothetical protein
MKLAQNFPINERGRAQVSRSRSPDFRILPQDPASRHFEGTGVCQRGRSSINIRLASDKQRMPLLSIDRRLQP